MSDTLEQFTRKLTDSGLMSVEQLQAFCDRLTSGDQPPANDELSRQLVENRILTEYQVGVLTSKFSGPLVVGDYVILEKIGAGGMGVVFKGQHRRMKRTVALKMLSTELSEDDSAQRRFEREVEVAAKLHHPNIVSALDAREEQGIYYLIMEYVEGRTLATIVSDQGFLKVDKAVSYIMQAAAGCAHAHELGVIHRDIKPSNLLVDTREVVRILDMGLAREHLPARGPLATTEFHLTGADTIMGTIDYMSPEQALNSHQVDQRTDIYSLGCTLYYLLVGRPIYAGHTPMEKLVAHREQPIPPLRDARDDVPAALDAVYQRMVAKHAEDRFQSMAEVIQALRTYSWHLGDNDSPASEPAGAANASKTGLASVATAGTAQAEATPLLPQGASYAVGSWKRVPLVLVGRCAGAVLGGFGGAEIGALLGGLGQLIGTLVYIWFGWQCGGGYAGMLAELRGWGGSAPDTKLGRLFAPKNIWWHVIALVLGGILGTWTGGLWRGIFLSITVLALVVQRRAK